MTVLDAANNVFMDSGDCLKDYQSAGVKRLISLYPQITDDFLKTYPCELGFDSFPMPSSKFFPPDDSAISKIMTLVPDGKMTVIVGPKNHLAYVVAAYRMQLLGWRLDQAAQAWLDRSWWTFWWNHFLEEWQR